MKVDTFPYPLEAFPVLRRRGTLASVPGLFDTLVKDGRMPRAKAINPRVGLGIFAAWISRSTNYPNTVMGLKRQAGRLLRMTA